MEKISEISRKSDSERVDSLAEIHAGLSTLISKLDAIPKMTTPEKSILNRLYFSSIYAREDSIADAEFGTFDWLLRAESENDHEAESSIHEDKAPDAAHEPTEANSASNIQLEGDDQSSKTVETAEKSIAVSQEKHKLEANQTPEEDGNRSNPEPEHETKPEGNPITPHRREEKDEAEEELRRQTRRSFSTWLETGNQVYHISGKAGSGKSTLMKFLCQHSRLKEKLGEWARAKKLVFASFFFWNSGDREQKKLEGLYRSLLYETLRQCPELIKEAFPDYWARGDTNAPNLEGTPFRFSELKQAMSVIVGKHSFPNHRFCFFIDGLDEFEADLHTDHWDLAQGLQSWAVSPDIKICVSSRPHEEFLQGFNNKLRMHLHEMTRGDIRRFVYGVLDKDASYFDAENSLHDTVAIVVYRADGVFLWVRLVVRSLFDGIRRRYRPDVLQQKLAKMPKSLEPLFDQLFNSIDPSDRERSDKMLLLAVSGGEALNALMYSWIDDLADPDFPYSTPIRAYSDEEIRSRHETVRCQLDSLSKGLLEMRSRFQPGSSLHLYFPLARKDIYFQLGVDFFHRTVRDYLNDPERLVIIRQRLGQDFDTVDAIQRLRLAQFKFARTMVSYFQGQALRQTSLIDNFYDMFDVEGFKYTSRFLEECEMVLEHHRRTPFTYSDEPKKNAGIIAWGLGFQSLTGRGELTGRNISYLHFLVSSRYCNEYIIDRLMADTNGTLARDGASLLFTASSLVKASLTHELLKAGIPPDGELTVRCVDISKYHKYRAGPSSLPSSSQVTTVWMAFLFSLVGDLIQNSRNWGSGRYPHVFVIIEEFFSFGADYDVYFLLDRERNTDTKEAGGGSDSGEGLVLVSLEEFILHHRPPNLDVLMKHILKRKGSWLWQSTKQVVATALSPWMKDGKETQMEYRRMQDASPDVMEGKYVVKTVCVGGRRLERGFIADWY